MPSPRRDAISALLMAGNSGIHEYAASHDVTQDEVFSAYMTLALRAVEVAVELGAPMQPFRDAVAEIWAALPPQEVM